MKQEVRAHLIRFVRETLNQPLDPGVIDDATPLGVDGLDLESLAFIELSMSIEQQFGVTIPDDDLEAIAAMSLGDFCSYVAQRASQTATAPYA